jgi:hypothetical protein
MTLIFNEGILEDQCRSFEKKPTRMSGPAETRLAGMMTVRSAWHPAGTKIAVIRRATAGLWNSHLQRREHRLPTVSVARSSS